MGGMAQGGGNPFASLLGALGQQGGFGVGGAAQGGFGQAPQGFGAPSPMAPRTQAQMAPSQARGAQRFGQAVRGQQGGATPTAQPSLLSQVGMSNLQRGAQQQQGFQQAQAEARAQQEAQAAARAAAEEQSRRDKEGRENRSRGAGKGGRRWSEAEERSASERVASAAGQRGGAAARATREAWSGRG